MLLIEASSAIDGKEVKDVAIAGGVRLTLRRSLSLSDHNLAPDVDGAEGFADRQ